MARFVREKNFRHRLDRSVTSLAPVVLIYLLQLVFVTMKDRRFVEQASEQLLSRKALANRWGVCRETIKRAERVGLLRPIRFNERLLRYKLSDIVAIEAAGESK